MINLTPFDSRECGEFFETDQICLNRSRLRWVTKTLTRRRGNLRYNYFCICCCCFFCEFLCLIKIHICSRQRVSMQGNDERACQCHPHSVFVKWLPREKVCCRKDWPRLRPSKQKKNDKNKIKNIWTLLEIYIQGGPFNVFKTDFQVKTNQQGADWPSLLKKTKSLLKIS
jgi:hypothetical protein